MPNLPISGLPSGSAVSETDLFPDVQIVGVGPVKVTGAQIKSFTLDSPIFTGPSVLYGLQSKITNGDAQYCTIQTAGPAGAVGGNIGSFQFSDDTSCSFLGFFKTRSTVKGVFSGPGSSVKNNTFPNGDGDDVGEVNFQASDGTNYLKTGYFTGSVLGPVSTGIVPMGYLWGTMDTSGVLFERMRLTPNGHLLLGTKIDQNKFTVSSSTTGTQAVIFYGGSTGGGASIKTYNGYNSTNPIYGFWYNDNTGIGNPSSNVISFINANIESARFDDTGRFAIGSSPFSGCKFFIGGNTAGINLSNSAYSISIGSVINNDVTNAYYSVLSFPETNAASFSLSELNHFMAGLNAIGSGSSIGNQFGFRVAASMVGGTNNYGVFSELASGSGNWNIFASGTAANFFGGVIELANVAAPPVAIYVGAGVLYVQAGALKYRGSSGTVTTIAPA